VISATRGGLSLSLVVTAGVLAAACSGNEGPAPSDPTTTIQVQFSPASIDFGDTRMATVEVRNAGQATVGPVELVAGTVRDAGGAAIAGSRLAVTPSEIPTLASGATREVALELSLGTDIGPGEYTVGLEARVGGELAASLGAGFSVSPGGPPIGFLSISGPSSSSQGDVFAITVEARDAAGQPVEDPEIAWSVSPVSAGFVSADGRFVGYTPVTARVSAEAGSVADTIEVTVTPRSVPQGVFQVRAQGLVSSRFTSDHWEHGRAAYTGTWSCRDGGACGNTLYVWDVIDPASPVLSDSVRVDARVVNDVKVRDGGDLAIITHESSLDGLNGITLLDVTDPLHPVEITRFTAPDLSPGIHNVWIDGDYAYLVVDGAMTSAGLRVLDISDPANPSIVASFYGGSSFLHDVYVRDGLAFLSHWSAGLIVLDVGNGIAGGSPTSPREVSRIVIPGYRVHNTWYWPGSGDAFVGDEIGVPGAVQVIDLTDLRNPRWVATFTLPAAAPHNFWVDEAREIAYFAWYENGVQAVDASGELLGALEEQGRQIAGLQYGTGNFCFGSGGTCTWAPQLHAGHIFVSDLNTGLWVLQPTF
jgi:hypothetical protein